MNRPAYYQKIAGIIEQYGLFVQTVFDPDGKHPDFAYTIGLSETYGHELIVVGMGGRNASHFFNVLSVEFLPKGPLPLDTPITTLANLPTMFKECALELVKEYAVQAFEYYQRDNIRYLQLVMPDKKGHLPGDPAYDHAHMDRFQTLLYHTTH